MVARSPITLDSGTLRQLHEGSEHDVRKIPSSRRLACSVFRV